LAPGQTLVKRYTENLEAYNLCLKARYHMLKANPENLEKCQRYCEQAIALDPEYAPAHALMALHYWAGAFWGFLRPGEALPKGRAAALRALQLDSTLAEAHSALGLFLEVCDFDWTAAEREFLRALELNPGSADSHFLYGNEFLAATGRFEEAERELQRAVQLDPVSSLFIACLAGTMMSQGRHDQAIAQGRVAIELDPAQSVAHWLLAFALFSTGQLDQAIASAEEGIRICGRHQFLLMCLGWCHAAAGRIAEARQLLEELKARRSTRYVSAFAVGNIHVSLGEVDQGLEWFAQALEERDLLAIVLLNSPSFDPLRPHPAFQALLRKMNLAP